MDGTLDMQALLSRYFHQLLDGCGSDACQEVLCHSGRLNSTSKVVRRYTPRSARAIAMALCAAPDPRAHLCTHSHTAMDAAERIPLNSDGPRDDSSLMQLLCDTPEVKHGVSTAAESLAELHQLHRGLDELPELAGGRSAGATDRVLSNREIADALMPCLTHLLARLPHAHGAVWELVHDEVVSEGFAYPQQLESSRRGDANLHAGLIILDALDHEPSLRLLCRTLGVVARRIHLEQAVARGEGYQVRTIRPAWRCETRMGIAALLASDWCQKEHMHSNSVFALIVWLKKLFARYWNAAPVMQPGSVAHAVLEIFESFHRFRDRLPHLPQNALEMPLIRTRISEMDLAWSWTSPRQEGAKHLLEYRILFSIDQRFLCFKALNHFAMRRAHSAALNAVSLRRRASSHPQLETRDLPAQAQHVEEHYLLLLVSRLSLLRDTFNQLWQRKKSELRRPLRVRMGADELDIGHDLGGVQIEFFNLICRDVFSQEAQMFTTDPSTGLSYFQPCSLQPLHMFEIFGVLLALAIYNGINLPIRLPWIFYRMLSNPDQPLLNPNETTVEAIRDGWPIISNSLHAILLQCDVDYLDIVFPLEANGLRLVVLPISTRDSWNEGMRAEMRVLSAATIQHQGAANSCSADSPADGSNVAPDVVPNAWPGWSIVRAEGEAEPVTAQNKADYVRSYISWLYYYSVAPQVEALLRGFRCSDLADARTLAVLGPRGLQAYIEGTDRFDISDLKAAVRYDGYEAKQKYIQSFWRIVSNWPESKQKQLLKFVTAAERIPITGTSHITFIIKKATNQPPDALPTSSTCFGTLMLPKYASAEILAQKLDLALKYGLEGFGTG